MRLPIRFFAAVALLTSSAASAAPLEIQCPDRIALEEVARASYPSWELTADKGKIDYYVESIRLFDGHPSEMASLAPAKTTQAQGRIVDTWLLPPAESGRVYWVACAYRNSMTLLTKRLPDTVSRCRLTQKTQRSGALAGIESFVCQ
jgi:hypothetical protein